MIGNDPERRLVPVDRVPDKSDSAIRNTPGSEPTMTQATEAQAAAPRALILDLAKRHLFVETLETRNSDGLDFHEVAVWAMRAALQEAYAAGLAAAER